MKWDRVGRWAVMAAGAAMLTGCWSATWFEGECLDDTACGAGEVCTLGYCVRSTDVGVGMHADACLPMMEVCNGVDDDCDGVIDELPILGQPCFADPQDSSRVVREGRRRGRCAEGRFRCMAGVLTCKGLVLPEERDQCNGQDLDCDGRVDEDPPGEEGCDGRDNDCDGRIDEEEWPDEVCDGVDNDCNGEVDEAFPTLGEECSVGIGECRREGVWACTAGGSGVVCVGADGESVMEGEPSAELCDGRDNNCDGTADEDFGALGNACEAGVGACRALGVQVCGIDGMRTMCDVQQGIPREEVCDGENADEDCDGIAEEGCA